MACVWWWLRAQHDLTVAKSVINWTHTHISQIAQSNSFDLSRLRPKTRLNCARWKQKKKKNLSDHCSHNRESHKGIWNAEKTVAMHSIMKSKKRALESDNYQFLCARFAFHCAPALISIKFYALDSAAKRIFNMINDGELRTGLTGLH